MTRFKVLIVDDHQLVREGLRSMLERMPDAEVVGEARDGAEAVTAIEELHPDVVLMDISMPTMNGLEATRRATKLPGKPKILILSMHADKEYVRQAFLAGAMGYMVKDATSHELAQAVAAVARGDGWISPAIAPHVVDEVKGAGEPRHAPGSELTPRQREVLQLIAEGHATKAIAGKLGVSVKTIETHRAQIMERLDIHHIPGLVRYAMRAKIVPPEK